MKRGYAETEVRAYLRLVSSDFAAAAGASASSRPGARARGPAAQAGAPPSDQELITALGEETARVLGQARESAIELRNKAEEHARRVVREAQETARELRTTTQQAVETKTREAEDAARTRANEIVGEARGLRERVLADLDERRQELERQIADLRAGRGKLVETYELVERALGQAAGDGRGAVDAARGSCGRARRPDRRRAAAAMRRAARADAPAPTSRPPRPVADAGARTRARTRARRRAATDAAGATDRRRPSRRPT